MAKSKSAQIQQDLLASDQGSLYREVMQESYNTIFKASPLQLQASELLAHLERGQETWSQELQSSSEDAERGLVNQVLKKWPETRTWWNSYRSPVSVPSSDSSSSDDESASEKEDAGNVRQESSRITKPRASLLGKCDAGGHCCQPLEPSENLSHINKNDGNGKQGIEAGGGQNVCHKCGKNFTRRSSLNRHFQIHSNDKPYRCCTCGIHFSQRAYLNRHMRIHEEKSHSGGVPYECSDCGESFWRKASFNEHRKSHTTDGTYPCSDCEKSYAAERYLIRHVMQVHSGANLCKCSSCEKYFIKEKDLIRHQMENHPEDNSYQCPDCGKNYREKSSLIKHQRHHRDEFVCKFPECRKSFKDSRSLANHWRMHKMENPQKHLNCKNPFVKRPSPAVEKESDSEEYVHTCPDCGKCFKNRNCFANHQRTHARDPQGKNAEESALTQNQVTQVNMKGDTCFDCGKPLCTSSELGGELKAETEKDPNTCSDYGKIFRDQQSLANDQKIATKEHQELLRQQAAYLPQSEASPNKRPYGCSSCGRTYATHYNLRRHQQVHPECRPPRGSNRGKGYASRCHQKAHPKAECHQHKCTYCGKVFNTKSILCRHMEIHIKGKPYKCTVCGKAFAYRYTLAHHQESHKEEQLHPHKCSYCGKAFRTSTSLRRHQQLHLGSKPYKCNVCGKAFSYRYALTHHREIHVEGQFHKCSFCWKAFRTNHSLSRHKRIHTETRSYQCAICGKVFGTKYSLLRHQDMHENGRSGNLTSAREGLGDRSNVVKNQANTTEVNPNDYPGYSTRSEHQETHMEEKCAQMKPQSTHLEENAVQRLDVECPSRKSLVLNKDEVNENVNQFSHSSAFSKNETDSVENTTENSQNKDNSSLTRHQSCPAKENCIKGPDDATSCSVRSGATRNEASQSEDSFSKGSFSECSEKGGASTTSSDLVEEQKTPTKEDSTEKVKDKNPISDSSAHTSRQGTKTVKKKHMCSSCGKCYRDRYSLTTHQRTHTSERPYQCQTCEKSFRSPKDLKRHCLTHTDLRPFLCTECGKCFKSKSGIDKHLKAHKGEKPFCCSYCGKRVTTNSILRCHLRIHTGERPFKCTMCDQGYRSGWILKKHLEKHLRMNSSKTPRTNELEQSF